jgi:hypothetical protein
MGHSLSAVYVYFLLLDVGLSVEARQNIILQKSYMHLIVLHE